jgi:hypothetical protein
MRALATRRHSCSIEGDAESPIEKAMEEFKIDPAQPGTADRATGGLSGVARPVVGHIQT